MFDLRKQGLSLFEIFRTVGEYGQLQREWARVRDQAPQGDGHPVLVIPGFTANDMMTGPLRQMIAEKGYNVYGWDQGFNTGIRKRTAAQLERRLHDIYDANGRRKITIVGHSLGGICARELAREFPDMVRAVITLETPFGVGMQKSGSPAWLVKLISLLTDRKFSLNNDGMPERLLTPPPRPTTSVFSKTDIIADWRACLNPAGPHAENVEIGSSHYGGIWNAAVISVVLDRLAQPEDAWQPYRNAYAQGLPPNPGWTPKRGERWHFFRTAKKSAGPRPA